MTFELSIIILIFAASLLLNSPHNRIIRLCKNVTIEHISFDLLYDLTDYYG